MAVCEFSIMARKRGLPPSSISSRQIGGSAPTEIPSTTVSKSSPRRSVFGLCPRGLGVNSRSIPSLRRRSPSTIWSHFVDGERLRKDGIDLEFTPNPLGHKPKTLRRGEDFDTVVLGISVGALPPICRELIEDGGNPRFRAMIENSHTAMTQAFQIWL